MIQVSYFTHNNAIGGLKKNKSIDITLCASVSLMLQAPSPIVPLPFSLYVYKFIPFFLIQFHRFSICCIYFF